jgi:hypothetical protein
VFEQRLRQALPLVADRVLHRIRETRGGQLYDSRFGTRGRGEGGYAEMIRTLFDTTAARLGFDSHHSPGTGSEPPAMSACGQSPPALHASGAGMVDDPPSGDVEDVQDDRQAAVAQRKPRAGSQAQLTLGFEAGGGHDGGAPAAKVRA